MVKASIFVDPVQASAGTGLRVQRPEDNLIDAGLVYRPGAHQTWFQSNVEGAPGKAPRANGLRSLFHGHDFRVTGGLPLDLPTIVTSSDDLAVFDYHGSHRNFTNRGRKFREAERFSHEYLVIRHRPQNP